MKQVYFPGSSNTSPLCSQFHKASQCRFHWLPLLGFLLWLLSTACYHCWNSVKANYWWESWRGCCQATKLSFLNYQEVIRSVQGHRGDTDQNNEWKTEMRKVESDNHSAKWAWNYPKELIINLIAIKYRLENYQ